MKLYFEDHFMNKLDLPTICELHTRLYNIIKFINGRFKYALFLITVISEVSFVIFIYYLISRKSTMKYVFLILKNFMQVFIICHSMEQFNLQVSYIKNVNNKLKKITSKIHFMSRNKFLFKKLTNLTFLNWTNIHIYR